MCEKVSEDQRPEQLEEQMHHHNVNTLHVTEVAERFLSLLGFTLPSRYASRTPRTSKLFDIIFFLIVVDESINEKFAEIAKHLRGTGTDLNDLVVIFNK